jgi:hypothetical protein
MMRSILPWLLFVPVAAPLLLALLAIIVRRLRALGATMLVGLLAAGFPLLPLPGLPRQTPPLRWMELGDTQLLVQLSAAGPGGGARAAMSLLLLFAAALGLSSGASILGAQQSAEAPPSSARNNRLQRLALGATLLVVAGGQWAMLSSNSLVAVVGLGLACLGALVADIATSTHGDDRALSGSTAPLLAVGLLLAAALADPSLARTVPIWAVGCGVLIFAGPLRLAAARGQLLFEGVAQAVGLSPVGVWLLVSAAPPDLFGWLGRWNTVAVAGAAAFVLGAANTVRSRTLRETLGGQWLAQLGLALLAWGLAPAAPDGVSETIMVALASAVLVMLCLSLMAGLLALQTGADNLAQMPPLSAPLRRAGLVYAAAAASAAGLPWTLGYTLRRLIAANGAAPFVQPLLLAGSSLLLLGLLPPLVAFFRRPAIGKMGTVAWDPGAGAGTLLGFLLLAGGSYQALGQLGGLIAGDAGPGAILALLPAVGMLLVVAYAHRSMQRVPKAPVFNGGLPLDEEPGWPLPFDALRGILTPIHLHAFSRATAPAHDWRWRNMISVKRAWEQVERRYYLPLIVLAMAGVVLLAAGAWR